MSKTITTLSVVNLTGKRITQTGIDNWIPHDWDYSPPDRVGPFRPDLNFTGGIESFGARCEREDINSAATDGANFQSIFYFDDDSWLRFSANQRDALSKIIRVIPFDKPVVNSDLEVYQMTGEDNATYSNAFYIRSTTVPDNSTWMSQLLTLKPNVKLGELTMPGSHDAGMYEDNGNQVATGRAHEYGGEDALTQFLDIGEQLKAGARYFDLRVYYDNDDVLWAYHGQFKGAIFYGTFGGKFETMLEDIRDFFNGVGANEAVIIKITPYDGAWNLQTTIDLVRSKLGNLLFTDNSASPDFYAYKLDSLKGRVVATFDQPFASLLDPLLGTFLWQNGGTDTGTLTNAMDGLVVYDVYSDKNIFADMEKDQSTKLALHGGYGRPYLYLLSWTITGQVGGVLDLELLSRLANPQLPKKLGGLVRSGVLPNIVYIDGVEPYLCSAIIATNFPERYSNATIYCDSANWQQIPLEVVRIAGGPSGTVYAISPDRQIYCVRAGNWSPQGGPKAVDLSVGLDGTVWVVSDEIAMFNQLGDSFGGFRLYKYENFNWTPIPTGAVVRVAPALGGLVYTLNAIGDVWRFDGTNWSPILQGEKTAMELAVGPGGALYIISNEPITDEYGQFQGYSVYTLGSKWDYVPDCIATQLAIAPDGGIYAVTASHEVWLHNGATKKRLPGVKASDISIGADGMVWVAGWK